MKFLNKHFFIALGFLLTLNFSSATNVSAQIEPADIDTLYHAQVAPGMFHTEYEVRRVPWRLQILRIDQTLQDAEFRTVKANNQLTGRQRPSEMMETLENDSVYVVAGINGDFYGTGGVPINTQVIDGTLLKRPFPRDLIAFDTAFQPIIQTTSFSGMVRFDGQERSIDGVNEARGGGHLTVYNSFYGSSTGTNQFGTEVGVRLIDKPIVNQEFRVVVDAIQTQQGDMSLESYDMVLSGHESGATFLGSVEVGDTLTTELNLDAIGKPVIEAIGGSKQFLKNGVIDSNWEERHPRTAVGFSADTSNVYFVVVDGRQARSVGMKLSELGEFLKLIGVEHALNLDGGGSSAMVIQNDVVNNPSDGGLQRAVANALFVTMENPGTGQIQNIQVRPGYQKLFIGRSLNLTVQSVDQYYRREAIDPDNISYSADEGLGDVSGSGVFTASFSPGEGYIIAESNGFADSTRIEIIGVGEINLMPEEIAVDTTMQFEPRISIRDRDGLPQTLDRRRLSWSVTDESVGGIDSEGRFSPVAPGRTGVIAAIGNVADTVWVEVSQDEGALELSSFDDLNNWQLTTENLPVENVTLTSLDDEGIRLSYSAPSGTDDAKIILTNSIGIPGVPQFAHIETSGDGKDYILFLDIANLDGGQYRIGPQRFASHTEPEVMEFIFDESWANRLTPGASFYFPFSSEALVLQIPDNSSGEDVTGEFNFHSMNAVYSETSVSVDTPENQMPSAVKLHQNYPNPFNPVTTIGYELSEPTNVTLEVYDLLGRKVAQLFDGDMPIGRHEVIFNASQLSSGFYFYKLSTDNATLSRQMMLIK